MGINKKTETLIEAIAVPYSVSEKQAEIAKKIVKARLEGNLIVQDFCSANGISSKSYYKYFENEDFASYVNQLQDAVIPTDEREAWQKVKKQILKLADKPNLSIKELDVFMDVFSYVIESDKRERSEALGLTETKKPLTAQTLDDKKAVLLTRLKG